MPENIAADTAPITDTAPATPEAKPQTPPANTPPADPSTPPDSKPKAPASDFTIPDAYKDKPWASKVKNQEDLWKQLENTQTLIGKKHVAPDFKTATPTEIEEYFKGIRPADKKAYKFDDNAPDYIKEGFSDLLFKNGISEYQADNLIKGFNDTMAKQLDLSYGEASMKEEMKKSFGDNYEEVTGKMNTFIKANLSPEDQKKLDGKMPNELLGLFYRMANNLHKAYGIKDDGLGGDTPPGNVKHDVTELRTQIRKQINDLVKGPHTADQKKDLTDKLSATYKK